MSCFSLLHCAGIQVYCHMHESVCTSRENPCHETSIIQMYKMKGTKVQTLGACAVAGTWCMAGWLLGPGP